MMAKQQEKQLYFSHDKDARYDPKLIMLRADYGWKGYGWFWAIVERMRSSDNYKLRWNEIERLRIELGISWIQKYKCGQFVDKCVDKYGLFESDGEFFWSASLCRRMEIMNEKSVQNKKNAEARWNSKKSDNNKQEVNANAMRIDATAYDEKNESMRPHCENEIRNANKTKNKRQKTKDLKNSITTVSVDKLNGDAEKYVSVLKLEFMKKYKKYPYPYKKNQQEREREHGEYDAILLDLVRKVMGNVDVLLADMHVVDKAGSMLYFIKSEFGESRWGKLANEFTFQEHVKLKQEWAQALEAREDLKALVGIMETDTHPDWMRKEVERFNTLNKQYQALKLSGLESDQARARELRREIADYARRYGI